MMNIKWYVIFLYPTGAFSSKSIISKATVQ